MPLCLPAGAQDQPASTAEREVRAFIQILQDALARKDRPALEKLIAADFTAIDRQGTVRDRSGWIETNLSGGALFDTPTREE